MSVSRARAGLHWMVYCGQDTLSIRLYIFRDDLSYEFLHRVALFA